jgi:hypothetical protein
MKTSPKRFLAIDWSGREPAAGQRRHIYIASWCDGAITLENGYTRDEVCDLLLTQKASDLVVGLDFAFSFPAWWVRELGCNSAPELWCRAASEGEQWLRECREPFWGRPGHPKPRRRDGMRQTDRQLNCKSPFQVGGAGSVGTGSIRGMPMLARLSEAGFHIWPFHPAKLPLVFEIYPRFFTGAVNKSNQEARERYLGAPRFASLQSKIRRTAASSEDAFDALCSVLGMVEQAEHLNQLPEGCPLEGTIWHPEGGVGRPTAKFETQSSSMKALEIAILELLDQRGQGKTICPSDAARHVDPENWRSLMELMRAAGQRLAAHGEIEVTQKGRAVDPTHAKGPIRYRRVC